MSEGHLNVGHERPTVYDLFSSRSVDLLCKLHYGSKKMLIARLAPSMLIKNFLK